MRAVVVPRLRNALYYNVFDVERREVGYGYVLGLMKVSLKFEEEIFEDIVRSIFIC